MSKYFLQKFWTQNQKYWQSRSIDQVWLSMFGWTGWERFSPLFECEFLRMFHFWLISKYFLAHDWEQEGRIVVSSSMYQVLGDQMVSSRRNRRVKNLDFCSERRSKIRTMFPQEFLRNVLSSDYSGILYRFSWMFDCKFDPHFFSHTNKDSESNFTIQCLNAWPEF